MHWLIIMLTMKTKTILGGSWGPKPPIFGTYPNITYYHILVFLWLPIVFHLSHRILPCWGTWATRTRLRIATRPGWWPIVCSPSRCLAAENWFIAAPYSVLSCGWWLTYTCVCICIIIYIYVQTHAYIYMCVHTCIYIYIIRISYNCIICCVSIWGFEDDHGVKNLKL